MNFKNETKFSNKQCIKKTITKNVGKKGKKNYIKGRERTGSARMETNGAEEEEQV